MKTILQAIILIILPFQLSAQLKPIPKISDLKRWKIKGNVSKLTQYVYQQDNTKPGKPLDDAYVKFLIHFNADGFITLIEQFIGGYGLDDTKNYEFDYTYENGILTTAREKSLRRGNEPQIVIENYQFINDRTYKIDVRSEDGTPLGDLQFNLKDDLTLKEIKARKYNADAKTLEKEFTTMGPERPTSNIDLRNAYFLNKTILERYPSGNEKVSIYPSEGVKSTVVKSFYEYYN